MPILVLLIKHFLSMRGLNEPYVGGLGSFSVTCLVISMLQLLPSIRSGCIDPRLHLGVMLLEFLELYGKNFNTDNVGIRVDEEAPGYFSKKGVFDTAMSKPFQLVIQDPNDPKNDVSKSSYAIRLILSTFSDAYDSLIGQMTVLDRLPFSGRVGRSILSVIIGGDYGDVERQRARMKQVYISKIGNLEGAEAVLKEMVEQEEAEKAKKLSEGKTKAKRKKPVEKEQAGEGKNGQRKGNGEPREKVAKQMRGDVGENAPRKEKTTRRERNKERKAKFERKLAAEMQGEATESKGTKARPDVVVID